MADFAVETLEADMVGLDSRITEAASKAGIKSLTPVQIACLPHALNGLDVLAKAKTGTGKTLAFLIPTVERLLRSRNSGEVEATAALGVDAIRCVILSSTRELANQITVQAQFISKLVDFNVDCVLGGVAINPQKERLDPNTKGQFKYGGPVDLMIATPGRLMEHIESTEGFAARLLGCQILILDEVDQLLETGFQRNIEFIISKLPKERQSMCFSATVPDRLKSVLGLALRDTHVVVDCVGEEDVDTHERIIQSLIVHPLEQTLLALYLTVIREMQAHPEDYKILVFLPTARNAMFFTTILNQLGLGIEVMEIHSRKNQTQRTLTSDTYRRAKRAILMSSDISARGVDYPNVTLIVQLGAPTTKEVYVQRLGRTGRADSAGAGVLLLCAFERPFLSCLADLPIRDISESFVENAATKECAALEAVIRAASCGVDAEMCAHTYLAWLKAFNGPLRKAFKWSKQDLVDHSNLFALHVLGRAEPIPVPREHMKDMGLKDCKGLYMVDASEYSEFDSTSSLASMNVEVVQEDVWTVRPNNKIINPVFRQGSKAVGEALAALSSADIQNLEAELAACAGGMVIVGGFELSAEMVTIVKVVAPSLSRNSSSSTLKSLTALSRNPSASNMKGMGSTSSLAPMAEGEEKEEPVPTEAEIEVASARVQAAGGMMRELTKTRGQGGEEGEAMYKTAVAELTAAKAELKRMVALGKKAKK